MGTPTEIVPPNTKLPQGSEEALVDPRLTAPPHTVMLAVNQWNERQQELARLQQQQSIPESFGCNSQPPVDPIQLAFRKISIPGKRRPQDMGSCLGCGRYHRGRCSDCRVCLRVGHPRWDCGRRQTARCRACYFCLRPDHFWWDCPNADM